MKPSGSLYISKVLERVHDHLEKVEVGCNDVRLCDGIAWAEAFANKPSLEYLYLKGNKVSTSRVVFQNLY